MSKSIYIVMDWSGYIYGAYTDVTEALSNIYDEIMEETYFKYHTQEWYFDKNEEYFRLDQVLAEFGPEKVIRDLWEAKAGEYRIVPADLLDEYKLED